MKRTDLERLTAIFEIAKPGLPPMLADAAGVILETERLMLAQRMRTAQVNLEKHGLYKEHRKVENND
jgi:hypothetical protein